MQNRLTGSQGKPHGKIIHRGSSNRSVVAPLMIDRVLMRIGDVAMLFERLLRHR